jgi:hypothetical protein
MIKISSLYEKSDEGKRRDEEKRQTSLKKLR